MSERVGENTEDDVSQKDLAPTDAKITTKTIKKNNRLIQSTIEKKREELLQHERALLSLCHKNSRTGQLFYQARENFFEEKAEYEETWEAYQETLETCKFMSDKALASFIHECMDEAKKIQKEKEKQEREKREKEERERREKEEEGKGSPRKPPAIPPLPSVSVSVSSFENDRQSNLEVGHVNFESEVIQKLMDGAQLFNQKPKNGMKHLMKANLIGMPEMYSPITEGREGEEEEEGEVETEERKEDNSKTTTTTKAPNLSSLLRDELRDLHSSSIAWFLFSHGDQIDQAQLGDYLSERSDEVKNIEQIREDFFQLIDLRGKDVPSALRQLLSHFRLPGESQKIERLLESFAKVYYGANPSIETFKTSDTVLVLAYSLIMLNTDAHNPQVKHKMKKDQFLKNNRGINEGEDLPSELLESMYDDIVENEIKMKKNSVFPKALKRGWVNIKAHSWVLFSRRWVVLNDRCLHIFKSEADTEASMVISLKGIRISENPKRNRIVIQTKDKAQLASGNFPLKIETELTQDWKEWHQFIIGHRHLKKRTTYGGGAKPGIASQRSPALAFRPSRVHQSESQLHLTNDENEDSYYYDLSEKSERYDLSERITRKKSGTTLNPPSRDSRDSRDLDDPKSDLCGAKISSSAPVSLKKSFRTNSSGGLTELVHEH